MENGSELNEEKVILEASGYHLNNHVNGNGLSSIEEDSSQGGLVQAFEEEASQLKPVDYSGFTKKEFVGLLKEAAAKNDFKAAEEIIREIKPLFDEMRSRERAEALARFKLDGGNEDDFYFKGDEWDTAFDIYIRSIRENRHRHLKELEEIKNSNLVSKNNVLEKLRQLVDGEDTEHSFRQFKDIQKEWKSIGAVPQTQIKTLWANYNALVDRFYDQRSIYFELKELDRRKNLELKYELCARAEKLIEEPKIHEAVKELNELHNEFRHIGPVPMEEKELVWKRFKSASDAIYTKRDGILSTLLKELESNLSLKQKVIEELSAIAGFQSDSIKEWNQKTKEIIELQKRWEAIGGVPRSKMRDINKKFWSDFKTFFHSKNVFFKRIDEDRSQNLKLKTELVNRALELKENTDWESVSNELKELQRKWKEIGPVPEKYREKVFQQFKQACDYFFEHRRQSVDKEVIEQRENLEKKEGIIASLEKIAEEKNGTLKEVKELQDKFNSIGFVPKRSLNTLKARFSEALTNAISSLPGLGAEERNQAALQVHISNLRQDPLGERKIHQKEYQLRKQISKAENDLVVLQNNLEFFGRSKNAAKMKEEFNVKIQQAGEELQNLKKQLQMLMAS
ncbi:MAG TPA: DUF349 domain-containing protein [Cytophagales bacterium]|jgi:hypothetical protein|nr:DUF349 domain-containing protein [Cytophagales bacterium]